MKIVCPHCAFERSVPEERLPSASVIATCPHCQHRFRVIRGHGTEKLEEAQQSSSTTSYVSRQDGVDDPLPPGALIPLQDRDENPPLREEQQSPPRQRENMAPQEGQTTRSEEGAGNQYAHTGSTEEEEKEYRRQAAAAYERQAEAEHDDFALENPWEHSKRDGYFAAFYQTTMRVMFAAPRFFAGLKTDTPQSLAIIFYLLVSVLQSIVERFWSGLLATTLAPMVGNDPQLQKLILLLQPESNIILFLLMRVALVTMELFIIAGLFFLVFKLLVPERANYSLIFQVLAYCVAPSVLCVVPGVGSVVGFIWTVACSFVGCRFALDITWKQTTMALVPIYVLTPPLYLLFISMIQKMAG